VNPVKAGRNSSADRLVWLGKWVYEPLSTAFRAYSSGEWHPAQLKPSAFSEDQGSLPRRAAMVVETVGMKLSR
jgi:hypothetical protein